MSAGSSASPEAAGLEPRNSDPRQWRWREVSPRRVFGTLLRGFGLIGILMAAGNYVLGRWNPDLDPPFLAVALALLILSGPVLWRVKPADWP